MKNIFIVFLILIISVSISYSQGKTITFTDIDISSGACIIGNEFSDEEFTLNIWCSETGSQLYRAEWKLDIYTSGNYILSSSPDYCSNSNSWTFDAGTADAITFWIEMFEEDGSDCDEHYDDNGWGDDDDCISEGTITIDLNSTGGAFGSPSITVNYTVNETATGSSLPCPEILPIEMGDFSGLLEKESITLNWETILEDNTEYFSIERSNDAKTWSFLSEENAIGKGGRYSFIDNSPLKGNNFYRLKVNDFDGMFYYSKTIMINTDDIDNSFSLSPNPANEFISINNYNKNQVWREIRIFNTKGQLIKSLSNSSNKIDISSLIPGSYYIQVITDTGVKSKQFVKR